MKFLGIAVPPASKGYKVPGKKLVVPDQSLSLQEILARFTRNEALPIGHNVDWGGVDDDAPESELEVDLEKLAKADMTYRDEWKEKAKAISDRYESEERARKAQQAADKEAAEKAKLDRKIRIEARKLAKKETGKAGSI